MNNKFPFIAIALLFLFVACERKPFVEHKIAISQTGEDCKSLQPNFRMNSNFGGERFEFEKCLPEGFETKSVTLERRGDTVLVKFGDLSAPTARSIGQITLDVDSYPRYNFITIDDDTYTITPAEK